LRIVQMKTGSFSPPQRELAAVISDADPKVIETFKNFGFPNRDGLFRFYDDCVIFRTGAV